MDFVQKKVIHTKELKEHATISVWLSRVVAWDAPFNQAISNPAIEVPVDHNPEPSAAKAPYLLRENLKNTSVPFYMTVVCVVEAQVYSSNSSLTLGRLVGDPQPLLVDVLEIGILYGGRDSVEADPRRLTQ